MIVRDRGDDWQVVLQPEHDVPRCACVANDHAGPIPESTWSAVTTSPYFVSMS